MLFEIKSRWVSNVLFKIETESFKMAVEAAVKSGVNLSGADLSGADLYRANLSRADLYRANLSGADLSGADLSRANLYGTNLSGADLYGADLSGADLSRADLSRVNLYGTNLSRANLSGANLSGADLSRAKGIKDIIQIGPIGSRKSYLIAIKNDKDEIKITAGCWTGTLEEFKKRVKEVHKNNDHAKHYKLACELIKARFKK